jgi:hypothetical protein
MEVVTRGPDPWHRYAIFIVTVVLCLLLCEWSGAIDIIK